MSALLFRSWGQAQKTNAGIVRKTLLGSREHNELCNKKHSSKQNEEGVTSRECKKELNFILCHYFLVPLSVRETGRNGELKWWKGARYEGHYKWVTIHHWPVRKPVSPHFKLQKSLSCLSVTKQHKLELSQQFDRQAGKPSVILVISESDQEGWYILHSM